MTFEDVTARLASGQLPVCSSPIFVIGCPRSGTTALARALGEHPELWTSHESYFLNGLFGDGRPGRVHAHQRARSAPGWLITEDVERAEFLGYVGAGINALYTSRSDGRRWIDQTPLYTLMVDDLAELFPGAVFLHMLRDGRDVVASMVAFLSKFEGRPEAGRHIPAWAADFEASCATWTDYVGHAAGFTLEHPDRAHTVRNDALSTTPESGFAEMFDFLAVAEDPAPAAYLSTRRPNSSFGRNGASSRPSESWTVSQRATFVSVCGATMKELGFASSGELDEWAEAPPLHP
jgi:hypothetical protein